jgi:hypothetical protein
MMGVAGTAQCAGVQESAICGTQCEKVPCMEHKSTHNAVREGATCCVGMQEGSVWNTTA